MAEIAGFVQNSKAAVSLKYGVSQSGPIIGTFSWDLIVSCLKWPAIGN